MQPVPPPLILYVNAMLQFNWALGTSYPLWQLGTQAVDLSTSDGLTNDPLPPFNNTADGKARGDRLTAVAAAYGWTASVTTAAVTLTDPAGNSQPFLYGTDILI